MNIRVIELQEHGSPSVHPQEDFPEHLGLALWSHYAGKIEVEPPSFKTRHQWQLKAGGWVGHVPVGDELHIVIQPKVQLSNLFRMLEYAYRIPFKIDGDLIGVQSLPEYYDRLANILSKRVLDRSRKGLYREYAARSCRLPFVRGQVELESMLSSPWDIGLDCRFHESTADIEDNQILAWTLSCIARSGLCRDETAQFVRRAFRATRAIGPLTTCPASLCDGRSYNGLNDDYKPLHALCRFFLDHSGPGHKRGSQRMLPFLIDMARLYELFVAEWLRQHLPPEIVLRDQATIQLGDENKVEFRIDVLLIDHSTGRPVCLLDTKYKTPTSPSSSDIEQVIAYAKVLGVREAVLVYPQELLRPFESVVGGDIHVWTATFALDGDIEEGGRAFLSRLFRQIGPRPEGRPEVPME